MMQYINKVPTMEKFLFFLDLRIGAMIAAVYGIFMCSLASPSIIIYINYFRNAHQHHIYENDPTMVFDFISFIVTILGIAALSVVLLIGAFTKDVKLVRIYVIGMIFCLTLMLVVTILSLVMPMFSFWGDLIVLTLYIYAWLTAHSLHQKLESGANLT
ncbi:uncharacterized protein LOC134835390 [Culicoides brevitarsis]|uniref:uncharacterized protein LOC134835390 n=1 Tax=Culicoides brevitarsis TaxID=469753 RepID=UPI00307C2139